MRRRVGGARPAKVDRATMRILRGVVFSAALVLTVGCTRKDKASDPSLPGEGQPVETSALALPVVAPMQARERLLDDMRRQQAAAQARKAEFEAITGGR